MFWILISTGALFEVIGDVYFRKQTYILGTLFYGLGTALWAVSLRFETLSKAVILFGVLNALAASIAGIVLFHETLTPTQWLGVCLGLGCLATLS